MRALAKLVGWLFVLIVTVLIAGTVYQTVQASADLDRYPPPGRLYDVDGLRLHLDCRGDGTPTVILEAGLASGSSSWRHIHDPVAGLTRVCAYDRPGMGWSGPSDDPASAADVAARLDRLLATADIRGETVIVGMSAGGIFARAYQRAFPDDVVAMVLVDSSHEQQGNRLPQAGDPEFFDRMLGICSWLQPVGIVRALGLLDAIMEQVDIPEAGRALAYQSHTCRSMLLESTGFTNDVITPDGPRGLGDLPLIVLSQGKPPEANPMLDMSLEEAAALVNAWDVLQRELAALSSRGERRIATGSGHVIQIEQPQIVVDAITDLVDGYR